VKLQTALCATFALILGACVTRAAEAEAGRTEKLKKTVALINGKDAAASLKARNELFAVPFTELKPLLPQLIKAVRDGSGDHDHAHQLLSLLGPDCGEVLPVILKEIRTEKNALRRCALVRLIRDLGSSARKGLRDLQLMQRDDRDAGMRRLTAKTIKIVDYDDAKAAEALRLLKLEKYASIKEHRAAWAAMEEVQRHNGVNVKITLQLTRWTLIRASRKNPPYQPETGGFFEYGPASIRIAMPVIREAIESKDERMRAAGLELLAMPVRLPRYTAWYPCHELMRFLKSPNPAVRRDTAAKLASIRKRIPASWLSTHPIETAIPELRHAWFKDKDMSVCKACREALDVFKKKNPKAFPASDPVEKPGAAR